MAKFITYNKKKYIPVECGDGTIILTPYNENRIRPYQDEDYFRLEADGEIIAQNYRFKGQDEEYWEQGNCFFTMEEAIGEKTFRAYRQKAKDIEHMTCNKKENI